MTADELNVSSHFKHLFFLLFYVEPLFCLLLFFSIKIFKLMKCNTIKLTCNFFFFNDTDCDKFLRFMCNLVFLVYSSTVPRQRDTNLRVPAWTKPEQLHVVRVSCSCCMCGSIHYGWSVRLSHVRIVRNKRHPWIIFRFWHTSACWDCSNSSENLHNIPNSVVLWQVSYIAFAD